MSKKMNLEKGFLILYDWVPALDALPAKEFKLLMLALIARQREGRALPEFRNRQTRIFAQMIEPVICRRLASAKAGKEEQDP